VAGAARLGRLRGGPRAQQRGQPRALPARPALLADLGVSQAQVNAAVNFFERYEHSLAAQGRRRAVTGVVCGHAHKPEMRVIEGVEYFNDGNWVES
jgi:UDP-2,3-diacylglucosamine pyrophosphatase LpxH